MDLELLKRRTEMLDSVCKGFHPAQVISQMAEKYKVSQRCLWSDWERRDKWVPMLLSLEKYAEFTETAEMKLNAVQKAAWSTYTRADNDSARVGALRLILDSLEVHSNAILAKSILSRLERVEVLAEKRSLENKNQ